MLANPQIAKITVAKKRFERICKRCSCTFSRLPIFQAGHEGSIPFARCSQVSRAAIGGWRLGMSSDAATMDLVTGRLTTVTPAVRSKLAQLGGRGEQWLAGLPDLITELEELWSMTVVQPLGGGSEAFVARVRCSMRGRCRDPRL
jgi:hypothetical protein